MSDQLYETLKQTALNQLQGYQTPKPFNKEAILRYRTPECIQYLHPLESLPSPLNESINNDRFAFFMDLFSACLDGFRLDIKDLVVDVRKRTVVVRATGIYDFKAFGDEPKEHGYTTEYMILLEIDESGTRVARVEEYLDHQRLLEYIKPRAERYAESVNKSA